MKKELPTQEEIIERWIGARDQPLVSVCCTTYNHRKYIEDALSSFLLQDISLPFEIVITDDASSDGTTDIVRAYANLYPEIIKPLYQSNNRYSQGESPSLMHTYPRARGMFIAFCEGDDYWLETDKLSKQVLELSLRPQVDLCFHRCIKRVIPEGVIKDSIMADYGDMEKIFTAEEVIAGGGGFIPTPTIFLRASCLPDVFDYYRSNPAVVAGDYVVQTMSACRGGALYLPLIGSLYRHGRQGSWTSNLAGDNEFAYRWCNKILMQVSDMKRYFSVYYNSSFNSYIEKLLLSFSRKRNITFSQKCAIFNSYRDYLSLRSRFLFFIYMTVYRIVELLKSCYSKTRILLGY